MTFGISPYAEDEWHMTEIDAAVKSVLKCVDNIKAANQTMKQNQWLTVRYLIENADKINNSHLLINMMEGTSETKRKRLDIVFQLLLKE